MRRITYGPPGTGKTERLLKTIEIFLRFGVEPEKIGYFTFSKNAAINGKERAASKVNKPINRFPFFQTLHSFCFTQMGLDKARVMQPKNYQELGNDLDIEIEGGYNQDQDHDGTLRYDNPYLQLIHKARALMLEPLEYYDRYEPDDTEIKRNKLDIIFEDDDLIILNKPAGIVIHPGAGNFNNTIVNALVNYDKNSLSNIGDELRPGIVHRIDKNTSGLIVIAKNNQSHEHLSNQFNKHTITRIYQLLIWGKIRPSKGRIETLISRSSKNRQMMEVSRTKGKKAITNYKTLEIFDSIKTPTLSLLECKLETGRTHQIRVHMNYLGNSIVGDDKYKKKFKRIKNIIQLSRT